MSLCKDTPQTSMIDDEFLTCKLCSKFYEQPKILPCTHTYCSPCIQALLDKSEDPSSISCPECGEGITLPHGTVSDLKTNSIITSFTTMFKENGETLLECSTCRLRRRFTPASSLLDCGNSLCSNCSSGHHASWNHKLVVESVEGESREQDVVISQFPACTGHDEEGMEYFCETCKIPICATCLVTKHHSHEYTSSTEAVTVGKDIVMDATQTIREKLKVFKKHKEILSNTLSDILNTKAEVKQNINDHISKQIALLETKRERALKAVDDRVRVTERKFESAQSRVESRLSVAGRCLQLLDSLAARGGHDDLLTLDGLAAAYLRLEQIPLTYPASRSEDEISDDPESDSSDTDPKQSETNTVSEKMASQRDEKPPKITLEYVETLGDTPDGTDCHFSFIDFHGLLKIKRIEMPHQTVLIADKADGKQIDICDSGFSSTDTAKCFFPFHISRCGTIVDSLCNNILRVFQNDCTYMLYNDDMPHAVTSFRNDGYVVGHQKSNEFQIYDSKGYLLEKIPVPISYPIANISVDRGGNITTCEWGNNSVRVWSHKNGDVKVLTEISLKANAACVDSNGLVYTIEKRKNKLSIFDKSGSCLLHHITTEEGLENPVGLAFDKAGLMYVINQDDAVNVYIVICE